MLAFVSSPPFLQNLKNLSLKQRAEDMKNQSIEFVEDATSLQNQLEDGRNADIYISLSFMLFV